MLQRRFPAFAFCIDLKRRDLYDQVLTLVGKNVVCIVLSFADKVWVGIVL